MAGSAIMKYIVLFALVFAMAMQSPAVMATSRTTTPFIINDSQCPGPFAKFLEKHGICAQYTMSGTPQQNGVAKRRNRTLMDMVRHDYGYFIGYPEKSKGYRFYCPNHSPRIVETGNAKFIENGEVSGSTERNDVTIKEVRVDVPLPISTPLLTSTSNVVPVTEVNTGQNLNEETLPEGTNSQVSDTNEPQEVPLRRSERQKRSAISDDYVESLYETS
ncbi:Retrovirus-related Pol polyprotein from transposon TNT 1-94 [Senna tora]|uniref:Retrovirus-related Pol polyprotein from transposon TNT 1-94 n=1 Tax=Senna tora TaxID=362788 RepID=A0A834WBR4_9FABA|nr:Retrovirus-related Pol polyprotein from transposon TNT 1-94 [Senna tora]